MHFLKMSIILVFVMKRPIIYYIKEKRPKVQGVPRINNTIRSRPKHKKISKAI